MTTNSYSHPTNKYTYLVCKTDIWGNVHHIEIDHRKKVIKNWKVIGDINEVYNIYKVTETWYKAKKTEKRRIIVHRVLEIVHFQEKVVDKWKNFSDDFLDCKTLKQKF